MRLQQEEMMRQRQQTAAMSRICYQGNANNNANFGQQVRESAGLVFADASIPGNIHMVADGDGVISHKYISPRGQEGMDADDLSMFGNIP
jgi:hypothetical protein